MQESGEGDYCAPSRPFAPQCVSWDATVLFIAPRRVRAQSQLWKAPLMKLVFFYIFCLSDFSAAQEVTYRCDEGWWEYGDRCYRLLNNDWLLKTYAINVCTKAKAQLYVPSSQEEYDAVSSYINGLGFVSTPDNPIAAPITDVWVGCEAGTPTCIDGTVFDSTDGWWGSEYAHYDGDDCVFYEKGVGLQAEECATGVFQLLCEAPAAVTRSSKYTASPLSNRCLRGFTQKTVPKKSKTRCAAECLKEDFCVSFNFKDGVCDLNYSTRDHEHYSAFQEEEGCSYYEP